MQIGRCVNCRSEISVPDTYAQGDHIKCPACGTRHKVQRGEALRLVIADIAPLKDALRANEQMIARLEDEVRAARKSFGIGANGAIVGFGYVLWQLIAQGQLMSLELLWQGLGITVGCAVVLEVANFLFLGKRMRISRLTGEIGEAQEESRRLQQRIRDAGRV